MLKVDQLNVSYGAIAALRDVDVEVAGGEIFTVIGANGAGKSTLLKTIAGFLRPTAGRVWVEGKAVTALTVERRVRQGIVLVPEGRQVWPELTVEEHLRLGWFGPKGKRNAYRQRRDAVYELFPRLNERRRQRAGSLSGGEQQMLAIGRAIILEPRVLLLDEPTLGLAPVVNDRIAEALVATRSPSRVVILAEQNAEFGLGLADRGCVLEIGEVRMSGTTDDLRAHPDLVSAYLGTLVEPSPQR